MYRRLAESVRTATQAETIKSYVGSNWGDAPKEPSGRARLFLCLGRKIPQSNGERLSARLLEGLARTMMQGAGTGGAYAYVYAYTHTRMRTLPVLPFWRTIVWSAIWIIIWSMFALRCTSRWSQHTPCFSHDPRAHDAMAIGESFTKAKSFPSQTFTQCL